MKAYYLVGIIAISGDGRMTNQGPWLILYLFWQLGQALIEKKQHTEGKSGNNVMVQMGIDTFICSLEQA